MLSKLTRELSTKSIVYQLYFPQFRCIMWITFTHSFLIRANMHKSLRMNEYDINTVYYL